MSDHKAVVAYRDRVYVQPLNKSRYRRILSGGGHRRTAARAIPRSLEHVSTLQIEVDDNADTHELRHHEPHHARPAGHV